MPKEVSEKSTKKELWEAYQEAFEGSKSETATSLAQPPSSESKEGKQGGVSALPLTSVSNDGALRALDDVRVAVARTIADFNERAEKARKRATDEEARLTQEVADKKAAWQREEEQYLYERSMKRRKEEDEYALKLAERERTVTEKLSAKENDLREREERIKAAEGELKELRAEVAAFPDKFDKAVEEETKRVRQEAEREAQIKADLARKDTEREREVSKLRIQSLEDTIKRQQAYIENLERKFTEAHEQMQQLASTALEAGARDRKQSHDVSEREPRGGQHEASKA